MFEFQFPQYLEQIDVVKDVSHLKQLLGSYRHQFKGLRKDKYLYAQCKYCEAHIYYQKSNSSSLFELKTSHSQHNHSYNLKQKKQKIKELINNLPETINTKAAKAIALHQIQMTKAQFYYYWNRLKQPTLSFPDFMDYLDQMKCEIQSQPFSSPMHQPPDIFILVTPQMKKIYLQFGESVSFDLTFNVVKDPKEGKSWKLGVLACLSNSKHIMPVAIVLTTQLTAHRYSQIFKAIFEIMGKCPKVLVSDQQAAVGSALQQLKRINEFDGEHCYDLFHILRNVKAKLKNKENLRYFSRLGRAADEFQFEQVLDDAYQALEPEEINVLKRFVNERHLYCFAFLPNGIGLSSSTNINQKFHDILKEKIPIESNFTKVVIQMLKICNRMLIVGTEFTIEKVPIEEYLGINQLREVRYSVDKSIFKVYCQQFSKVIQLQVYSSEQGAYQVVNIKTRKKYKVNNLECSCKFREKTGIACSHLLKIFLLNKLSLSETIDKRWKVQTQVPKKIAKIGRRHTRRRRH